MNTPPAPSGPRTGPSQHRESFPVRLLVADDHPVVRSGIVGMLSSEEGLEVVGGAADGAEAVELAAGLVPDVVLMDLRMPVLDGVEAARRILALPHAPRVVVLTTYDTDGDILRAVEAGAIGYLLKDSPREDILEAVRAAAAGRSALSPSVTTRLVGAARGTGGSAGSGRGASAGAPVTLSPREREVLTAVSRGLSNSRIGRELYITEATVKTHLLRINNKLGVDSRTAAVTEALRRGLLDLG
nr:response regulator transcription factor [uncultured Actinomyces sp.]